MKRWFRLIADGAADTLAVVTAVLLAGLAFLITYSVILRYYFQRTIGWVTEVSEYTLYTATFLGAAWVLKHDEHVRMDMLVNALRPRTRLRLAAITSIVGALVCLALTAYGLGSAYELYTRGVRVVKFMALPKYLFILVIPLGLVLLALQFVVKAWDAVDELRSRGACRRAG